MSTETTTETTLLPGDRDAFSYKKWEGVRGWEWSAFDHLIGADIEHARTKKEASERIREQRAVIMADQPPTWIATAKARLTRHRAAYDAKHPRRTR